MPTTFDVFAIGVLADIDQVEGGNLADNAAALVGLSFGGPGNPLFLNAAEFSPGTSGFTGGTPTAYDQDNAPAENFRIDGGPDQVFDAAAIYNATITYLDGTTANITAVIFQDTAGNTYLAPEIGDNLDQAALEAGPIETLTLNSVNGASFSGLSGDRQTFDFVTCYVAGTKIDTNDGPVAIETLKVGSLVRTQDRGLQAIRWIGSSTVMAKGKLAPVRITAGALGPSSPKEDLLVSRQHRMLVQSPVCKRMFGTTEILVPAIKLADLPGIYIEESTDTVTYFHLMTDQHDVIFAAGAPSETMLAGEQALAALTPAARDELRAIFPDLTATLASPVRPIASGKRIARLIERHQKNALPFAATK